MNTTSTIRADGQVRGTQAWITIGYPTEEGRLRFGFDATITVDADAYKYGKAHQIEVEVGQAAIIAQAPAEARLRAAVYMLAVEVGEKILELLEGGMTVNEAFQNVVGRTATIDWNVWL